MGVVGVGLEELEMCIGVMVVGVGVGDEVEIDVIEAIVVSECLDFNGVRLLLAITFRA